MITPLRRTFGLALCAATLALGAADVVLVQPADAKSRRDVDGDRIPNGRDRDVDGDGKRNGRDRDVDGDGKRNGRDRDVDGDGKRNGRDRDVDGDRKRNLRDSDLDGDRRRNAGDTDMDGDGKPNSSDYDTDSSGNGRGGPPLPAPPGFFGAVTPDAFADSADRQDQVFSDIAGSGTRSVRQSFHWAHIETRPGKYDFGPYDHRVRSLAQRDLSVQPFLTDAPKFWSTAPPGAPLNHVYPPKSNAAFAAFARAIAARYGNRGSFWRDNPSVPRRPIRVWQVWNEPNSRAFWASGVDPAGYGRMLREVSIGLKQGDPQAEVLTAGMAFSNLAMDPEDFMPGVYAEARGHFDSVGVHAYAAGPDLVTNIVERMRRILNRQGDGGRPIRVSETGWGTAGPRGHYLRVSPRAQGLLVKSTFDRLARMRRTLGVRSVMLFSWRDLPSVGTQRDYWGLHAGLTELGGGSKPGRAQFAQSIRTLERPGAPPSSRRALPLGEGGVKGY